MIVAAAADGAAAAGIGALFVLYGVIVLSGLVGLGLGIWALIDLSSKPDWAWQRAGQSKTTYIVLIVIGLVVCQLLSLIASIVYLTSVRKRLDAAVAEGPPPYPYGYQPAPGYPPPAAYPPPGYPQAGYPPPGTPPTGYPPPSGQPGYGYPPASAAPAAPGAVVPGQAGPAAAPERPPAAAEPPAPGTPEAGQPPAGPQPGDGS